MNRAKRSYVLALLALAMAGAVGLIAWRFNSDMERAQAHAALGSVLLQTRCGPIKYQEAGAGVPLLAVHGNGGGHDQGMAFARPLAQRGIRVIAMSRFGYDTFSGAQYTASRIPGAKFVGFDHGGHTWVGHNDEVVAEIVRLLVPAVRP